MKIIDFYSVGSVMTLKLISGAVAEYIQCVIEEHLDIDPYGNIVEMRLSQIINLEDYYNGKNEDNFRERVVRFKFAEFIEALPTKNSRL